MGQNRPRTFITTTHRPSENTRLFAKTLAKVIPRSTLLSRGTSNLDEIVFKAKEENVTSLIVLHSKGSRLSQLVHYTISDYQLIPNKNALRFYQFIDYKIMGWERIPTFSQLSISREARIHFRELIDFFIEVLQLEIAEKTNLWLMIDKNEGKTYIQFVDALTMKKILFAEVKLLTMED